MGRKASRSAPRRSWLAAIALAPAVLQAEGPASPVRYDVEGFDARAVEAAARSGAPVELRFFGASHRMQLEPSAVRSDRLQARAGSLGAERSVYLPEPRTFKGRLEGDPDSMVRLSAGSRGLRGYIRSSSGWTFIEPFAAPPGTAGAGLEDLDALGGAGGASPHKVYTEGDLDPGFLGHCGEPVRLDPAVPGPAHEAEPGAAAEVRAPRQGAEGAELLVLELAVDADFELYQLYGDGAAAEIESVINMVDGIYERDLGISIQIVSINVWDAEPDPYDSMDSGSLLSELRTHWNAQNGAVSRDAAHLFTGKELDGSTVGIAYVSVVCSTSVAYALSQDLGSEALMPLLVAHEIGHNLGANHDPSGSTPRYIMYPSLGFTNLDQFSEASADEVADYVAAVSCLASEGGGESDPPPGDGGGGGGGGGGGPVDPFLVVVLAGAAAARRILGSRGEHG
ncbi:MAG: hypothetical protein HY721_13435 [Planctomycetes bacterium]|nr:hypothetical protein [Planctomycetota bacterium]